MAFNNITKIFINKLIKIITTNEFYFLTEKDVLHCKSQSLPLLACTWRYGDHVGGQEQKHFSPLAIQFYFHVNSSRKNSIELTPNMVALWRCMQTKNTVFAGKLCNRPLGMQNGHIRNAAVTSSSLWNNKHAVHLARLHNRRRGVYIGRVSARTNNAYQWLQIFLGRPHKVICQ